MPTATKPARQRPRNETDTILSAHAAAVGRRCPPKAGTGLPAGSCDRHSEFPSEAVLAPALAPESVPHEGA
ncbi:MAG TPA: hypothetical protein DEP35_18065 [Deltaproteobacteria bacterium]|nr:hypothetical protein [Deltaproteobacteria bacterium]